MLLFEFIKLTSSTRDDSAFVTKDPLNVNSHSSEPDQKTCGCQWQKVFFILECLQSNIDIDMWNSVGRK